MKKAGWIILISLVLLVMTFVGAGINKYLKVSINRQLAVGELSQTMAAIDAARAGAAGKGFAVVANEIKELARQTADATAEIKNRIEGIQVTTKTTVKEIGNLTNVVNGINDIAGEISDVTQSAREISGNSERVDSSVIELQSLAESFLPDYSGAKIIFCLIPVIKNPVFNWK